MTKYSNESGLKNATKPRKLFSKHSPLYFSGQYRYGCSILIIDAEIRMGNHPLGPMPDPAATK